MEEINALKKQIDIKEDDLVKTINPGEKVIAALFVSTDQQITYSIACKNTTLFVKLEEKLYDKYPQYKNTDNYFLYNGNRVRRFKTIGENNIESGEKITLNIFS